VPANTVYIALPGTYARILLIAGIEQISAMRQSEQAGCAFGQSQETELVCVRCRSEFGKL